MKHLKFNAFASASVLALTFANSALALDSNLVTDALEKKLKSQGIELSWGHSVSEGSTIVLKDSKIGLAQVDESFSAGDIRLEGVEERDGGHFIGKIVFPDVDHTSEHDNKPNLKITGLYLEGVPLPPEGEESLAAHGLWVKHLNMDKLVVSGASDAENDKLVPMFSLEKLTADYGDYKQNPVKINANLDRFEVDFQAIKTVNPDADIQPMVDLGYEKITGKVHMVGTWNLEDGRMTIADGDYAITVDDAGKLVTAMDFGGYTLDLVKSLQELNQKILQEGSDDPSAGLAMMGLLQQLTLHGMAFRFEDDSITGKVLDYAAKQQGTDRASLVNQIKGILPFGLAQLQNPELAQQISVAVGAFLDDPKSLEISANPAEPLPIASIVATGMSAPQAIPQQINLKVTANK